MNTSENRPASAAPAGDAKPQEGYWLPEIVHLHLSAYEAGWLTGLLHDPKHTEDVEVNVPGPHGEKVATTMSHAIRDKLRSAWENHD